MRRRKAYRVTQINPDPRFVWLMNFAIESIAAKLYSEDEYSAWLNWAATWRAGTRSPQACVAVAHKCFQHKNSPIWHTLGQLAWGARECCYSSPQSGWLVVRYIADAMIAFGVAFPDESVPALHSPAITSDAMGKLE